MPLATRLVGAALLVLGACAGARRHPHDHDLPGPTRDVSLIERASADLAAGDHAQALARGLAALAADPTNVDAHAVVGAARWRAGDVAGSTAAYRRGVEIEPTHFGAVLGLARNLQAEGQHHTALAVLAPLVAQDVAQLDPHLSRLWSHFATADFDAAARDIQRIDPLIPAGDPMKPLVDHMAAFVGPLVGKGPFFVVDGPVGSTDAEIDEPLGLKRASVTIGGARHQAVIAEFRDECFIDAVVADGLNLATVGEMTPIDTKQRTRIVIVPEIAIGGITLRRVPAIVRPLDDYAAGGRTPGVVLGRHALGAFGSLAFDFPRRVLLATAAAPTGPAFGAVELPLLLPSMHLIHFPAVPIRIGEGPVILVYLGGRYATDVALLAEAIAPGEAPGAVPDIRPVVLRLGDLAVPGVEARVLATHEPDEGLRTVLEGTGLALAGYLDVALLRRWQVTYAFGSGRVYIAAGAR